ncbi:MAG: hypothetical protein Q9170_002917 [Blastenia crenularia]
MGDVDPRGIAALKKYLEKGKSGDDKEESASSTLFVIKVPELPAWTEEESGLFPNSHTINGHALNARTALRLFERVRRELEAPGLIQPLDQESEQAFQSIIRLREELTNTFQEFKDSWDDTGRAEKREIWRHLQENFCRQ